MKGSSRSPQEWLEGWFLGTPLARLRRGNLVEFLAWAFFTKSSEELASAERHEVDNMVGEMGRRFGWEWAEGFDPAAKCIRINFDSLTSWCHPFSYYASIWALSAAARQTMRLLGFRHHPRKAGGNAISFFHCAPPRPPPGVLIVGGNPAPSPAALPVVFIHGLGVGLAPYMRFIRRLAAVRECFVVELLEVSQSGTEEVLAPTAMAEAIAAMLRAYGHCRACFVAHSYGTFVLSWVVRERRDLVARAVLLDPVCFLLSQPDVAFNFLYRVPDSLTMMVVAHLVRWELFSANVLMRHFYWYHNVLWREELPEECVVVLAAQDDITDPQAVRSYLEEHQRQQGPSCQLKVLWLEGFFHGGILLSRPAQQQLMDLL